MKVKNITLAALALLLAACGNEEIIENNENGNAEKVPMTFTAGTVQTRTSLAEDGHAVNWTEGDKVAIYDDRDTNEFTATEVNGSTATLTGKAAVSYSYTAFYPSDKVSSIDNTIISFNLPAEQTAKSGSFDEKLNPSWAQATDGSTTLTFKNLCALAKFTVDADDVTEVTLTANAENAVLAGDLQYFIEADGTVGNEDGTTSRSVTLKGTFTKGDTYYFVVAPGTLTGGVALNYKNSEGKTYIRTTKSDVTFTAGKIANLDALNTADFEEALNPELVAAIAGQVSWVTNNDGIVPVDEANKQAMAEVPILDLADKNLSSLDGIEYFTGLEKLFCDGNQLKSLDVSNLTALKTLQCNNNLLESLDVSKLTALNELQCNNNQLESLDVSNLTALNTLQCYNNQLDLLDVSKLTQLRNLTCYGNKLSELDITANSQLMVLLCGNQTTGTLNLSLSLSQASMWDDMKSNYPTENSSVEAVVVSDNSEHGGFEDDTNSVFQ